MSGLGEAIGEVTNNGANNLTDLYNKGTRYYVKDPVGPGVHDGLRDVYEFGLWSEQPVSCRAARETSEDSMNAIADFYPGSQTIALQTAKSVPTLARTALAADSARRFSPRSCSSKTFPSVLPLLSAKPCPTLSLPLMPTLDGSLKPR